MCIDHLTLSIGEQIQIMLKDFYFMNTILRLPERAFTRMCIDHLTLSIGEQIQIMLKDFYFMNTILRVFTNSLVCN